MSHPESPIARNPPSQAMGTPPDAVRPAKGASRLQRAAGSAEAGFRHHDGRTRLTTLRQSGCLKLRFPRLPRPDAEAILINSSGGLTGGDRLDQTFRLGTGGDLAVTTQACERVYRALDGEAHVATRIELGETAAFSWLPQETILFDGGAIDRRLELDAAATSRFLVGEPVILGREMMGESVRTGRFRDRWRIRIDGRLAFADDVRLDGALAEMTQSPASLNGNRAFATVLCHAPEGGVDITSLREIAGPAGGASKLDNLTIVRIMAPSGLELRRRLIPVLSALSKRPLPLVWSL